MSSTTRRGLIVGGALALLLAVLGVGFLLGNRKDAEPTASPTPAASSSASPSASSTGSPSAPSSSPDTGKTKFGAAFQVQPGEGYANALQRTDSQLGRLDAVRVFYPEAPQPWPGKAPGRDVVVSFKLPPREVVAGQFDEQMRTWFATTPVDLNVHWVYWHEPENDIEDGTFTAPEFRSAFAHLSRLADEAKNPRLKATLVLMSFTTRAESNRNWKDYYPGNQAVDVFAWDVYNRPGREGDYSTPAQLMDKPRKISESVGKPFAVAELGSVLAPGDKDGSGRAEWLRALGAYSKTHRLTFVMYFDLSWRGGADDYRLRDPASLKAWAEARAL